VLGPDDGAPTGGSLTINKVTGGATRGGVDIVDHRMPAGYAPPMHVHSDSDEVFYIIDALYRRYPTRDALLDALTRRSFEFVLRCARAAESLDVSGLNCLDHFLDAILSSRTELVLPLHGGPAPSSRETKAVRSEVHESLQHLLERGQRDGSIRDDATTADIIIFGAMIAQPLPTISAQDAPFPPRTRWRADSNRFTSTASPPRRPGPRPLLAVRRAPPDPGHSRFSKGSAGREARPSRRKQNNQHRCTTRPSPVASHGGHPMVVRPQVRPAAGAASPR